MRKSDRAGDAPPLPLQEKERLEEMPLDLETIGYFLFMEEQERKEARSEEKEDQEEEEDSK